MDFNIIEDILIKNTDKQKYNRGFSMYKNKLVNNDYLKLQEDEVIFYANISDDYHRQNYTSMITINKNTRVISNMSCDCSDFISKHNRPQICSHIVSMVLNGVDKLRNNEVVDKHSEGIIIKPKIVFDITKSNGKYLGGSIHIKDIDSIEYKKIYNSYKENKKLHILSNKDYLDLEDKDFIKAFKIIDLLGMYNDFDNIKIPTEKVLYLSELIEEENIEFINGKKYIDNVVKKYKKLDDKIQIPNSINKILRDYQIKGFEFLSNLSSYGFGAILADDMGLGKTVQTIAFLLSKTDKKSIVIVPTSLIYNWKNEFDKFAPTLKVGLLHTTKDKREKILSDIDKYDVILTSYTTYKNDLKLYENIYFDYCIIDEAQNIKNPDAIITKAIKKINATTKIALTGTPIENNLLELWSIFDFVMPGYLYTKEKFKYIFVNSDKNIVQLKKMIKPFMLRRTKNEVIDELPPKIEQKYILDLEKYHKVAYKGYKRLVKEKISTSNDNMTVLSHLTRLRQLCLSPEIMVKDYKGKNSKLDILIDIVKDSNNQKILVFSQFTKVLELIKNRFEDENISYSYLDGKIPSDKRIKLVDEFNENKDIQVFLISLKAGGTGLNLTSASIVVHFDPWWNVAVENQASDRAHRIGQKNVVNVIKLVAKDTIEEKVILLQEAKKELINNIIDSNLEDNGIIKNMTKEEIIDLFLE